MFKLERKFTQKEFLNLQDVLMKTLHRKVNQSNALDWIDKLVDKYNGSISFGDRKWVAVELFYGTLEDLINNEDFSPAQGRRLYKHYADQLISQFGNDPTYYVFTHYHRNFKCCCLETMEYLGGYGIDVGQGRMDKFIGDLEQKKENERNESLLSRYVELTDTYCDQKTNAVDRKPFITSITIPIYGEDCYSVYYKQTFLFKGTSVPSRQDLINVISADLNEALGTETGYKTKDPLDYNLAFLMEALVEIDNSPDWDIPADIYNQSPYHIVTNSNQTRILFNFIPCIYEC